MIPPSFLVKNASHEDLVLVSVVPAQRSGGRITGNHLRHMLGTQSTPSVVGVWAVVNQECTFNDLVLFVN